VILYIHISLNKTSEDTLGCWTP